MMCRGGLVAVVLLAACRQSSSKGLGEWVRTDSVEGAEFVRPGGASLLGGESVRDVRWIHEWPPI
jgi:hypothetical protein